MAVLVAGFVLARWALTPPAAPVDTTSGQQAVSILTAVPAADLDRIGLGSAGGKVVRISEPALAGPTGRPEVLYVGAEYCPYCAAERWPLIVALSRFGTFSGVRAAASSA
ncbi:MAG TPA: DUF929 family protein, partial [Candidatus Eisenbacteria bacterium]|nr:DUF929 family protein [Candidatus Eisenbacteria bacterium]